MSVDWTTVKLGSHIDTQKGYAFKAKWHSDAGRSIVKVSNFTEDSVETNNLTSIPEEIAKDYLKYELHTDDVVIQTVGSWPKNPASVVGKVIKIPFRANGALLNQNAVKIIPDELIDNKFLFYLLRNEHFKGYIIGTAQGSANQASITLDSLRAYEFLLPPLPIQQKIAAILSAYDDLIENDSCRIKILEEMAQRFYREWFVDFRYTGHENDKLVESELGMIPEGWEVAKLGDVAQQTRNSVSPNEIDPKTPYFGLEHLPRKSIALGNWGYAEEVQSTKLAFKKGDILFGKIRPYFHKRGVAPLDGICSGDTIVITSNQTAHKFIVLCCVSSTDFVNHATQTSQGTKMPRANWDVLVEYPVLIPSKDVLLAFNKLMDAVVSQIINHIFRNRILRQTRDLLLPKLITGQTDVSELDIEIEGRNNAA